MPSPKRPQPKNSILKKILGVSCAVILVAILGAVYFLSTFDIEKLRVPVQQALSANLGRKVSLNGPLHLGLGTLSVEKIIIGNPDGTSQPTMMTIDEISFSLHLLPLLHKEISVNSIEIKNAVILLEKGKDGKGNWQFMKATPESATPQSRPASSNFRLSAVDKIMITNSHITMAGDKNNPKALPTTLDIGEAVFKMPTGQPLSLKVVGTYADQEFLVDLTGSPYQMLLAENEAWIFDLSVSAAGYKTQFHGSLSHEKNLAKINDVKLIIGDSELDGAVKLDTSNAVPSIQATLASQLIDMDNFRSTTTTAAPSDKAASPSESHIFSDQPIPFNILRSFNGSVQISAETLKSGTLTLTKIASLLKLNAGDMVWDISTSAPFLSQPAVGNIHILVPADATPSALVKFVSNSISLGGLMQAFGHDPIIETKGDMHIELGGRGNSLHEIAKTSVGTIRLITGNGKINSNALSLLSTDLPGFLTQGGLANPVLTCLVGDAIVKDGIAHTSIIANTTHFGIVGTGAVDLSNEQISMDFTPTTPTDNIASLMVPFKVTGSLTAPSIRPDQKALVGKAATLVLGAVDPTSIAEMAITNFVKTPSGSPTGDADGCAQALKNPQAAAQTKKNDASAAEPANPVQNIIQNGPNLLKSFLGK